MMIHEKPSQREVTDEAAFWRLDQALVFSLGPSLLEQLRIIYARRTGGHASEAAEAEVHFICEGLGRIHPAIGNCSHKGNSATRAIPLFLGGIVRGAGRQAEPAMHA